MSADDIRHRESRWSDHIDEWLAISLGVIVIGALIVLPILTMVL